MEIHCTVESKFSYANKFKKYVVSKFIIKYRQFKFFFCYASYNSGQIRFLHSDPVYRDLEIYILPPPPHCTRTLRNPMFSLFKN